MKYRNPDTELQSRFKFAYGIVISLFVVIILRLFFLQVIKGNYYRFFSTENSVKEEIVRAPRGRILDHRGKVLVENRPSFDITITPQFVVDPKKVFATVSKVTGLTSDQLKKKWQRRKKQAAYQPLLIKSDVSWDEMSEIRTRESMWYPSLPWDLRGVEALVRYDRFYPKSEVASHVLGYVREIDSKRLESYKEKYPGKYHLGDTIGVRGLEEKWDPYLRGKDGYEEKVVDASGREVFYQGIAEELQITSPLPGDTVVTTIDANLQSLANELFAGRKGAAVGVDVNTGAVRLLFSSPTYDLNKLSSREGSEYYRELARAPNKPLLNRAIQGAYPPGSTYKIITGIAALSEDELKPNQRLFCGGGLYFGGRVYKCFNKAGHGYLEYHNALARSCDVFFYRLGIKLGVDRLSKYAHIFGLGEKTGIGLDGERSGLIPTAEWKQKRFDVPWQPGENLSIAVGQGFDLVTPLQNAVMLAQVVNGGYKLKPFLVQKVSSASGEDIFEMKIDKKEKLPISDDIIKRTISALIGTVNEAGGTARRQSMRKIKMGGKTGTAQVVSLSRACNKEECKDHAWFVGFAPADDPKIAISTVVEHGGFGAATAAPIVGALLERYAELEGWIDKTENPKHEARSTKQIRNQKFE